MECIAITLTPMDVVAIIALMLGAINFFLHIQ